MESKINLYDVFWETAERQPEKSAVIDCGRNDVYTYGALAQQIELAAEKLRAAGVESKTCIGLHYPSGFEYVVWAYAVWKCGATIVPIAVELVPEEKLDICQSIHLNGVITSDETQKIFSPAQENNELTMGNGAVFISIKQTCEHPKELCDINAAFIRFTSGTTASSKGVVLSHETVYERIRAANEALKIGPDDTIIWLLSMSYHFTVSIVAYLTFGATIVLPKDYFGATIVKTADQFKATFIYGSPAHYHFMAHDGSRIMLPHLRIAISTATSLKDQIASAFLERFGIPLSQAYGIIEVGLPCINLDRQTEKRGSVGRPLPAYQLRMCDIGLGDDLKAIEVRGRGIIDAYYKPWRNREEIMTDGWFATGDLGKLDEEGYLFILGRSKEVISVGGMKFFPQEVEAVLEAHPGVRAACVFGHEHKRLGEISHAQVVLQDGADHSVTEAQLRKHCLKHLTAFKVPEKIEFVDKLALTASGKLIRTQIKIHQ